MLTLTTRKNRCIFVAAFVIYLSPPLFAQQNKIVITPLAGNIFVHTSFNDYKGQLFPSNGLFIVAGGGIIIIDTPWGEAPTEVLLDTLEKKYHKKVLLCVSTHYHDDRTGGLEVLKKQGVSTFMSKQSWELAREKKEKMSEFFFTKDTVFILDSVRIETFYPGEGHTKDNIVVWFEKEKVLFGGCLVKSTEAENLGNLADANVKEWPGSIKKVIKKFPEATFVVPGHFGWKTTGSLKHTLMLLKKSR